MNKEHKERIVKINYFPTHTDLYNLRWDIVNNIRIITSYIVRRSGETDELVDETVSLVEQKSA